MPVYCRSVAIPVALGGVATCRNGATNCPRSIRVCANADGNVIEQGQTSCCYAKSEKSWIDPAGISWETFFTTRAPSQSLQSRLTGRRSNRTARRRPCCASRLGCSRRRVRARDEMNSTTAMPHRLAILCGRYGQPWLRPGCCWSSCDRCDRHRPEKRDLLGLNRSGRRDGSVQSPRQE
jgi:hypothetical protein